MLRVLYIEDNDQDAAIVQKLLGNLVILTWVRDVPEQGNPDEFDIILLDLKLPGSEGMETVNKAAARFPNVPIVILSHDAKEVDDGLAVSGLYSIHDKSSLDPMALVRSIQRAAELSEEHLDPGAAIHKDLNLLHEKIVRLINRTREKLEGSGSNVPIRNP